MTRPTVPQMRDLPCPLGTFPVLHGSLSSRSHILARLSTIILNDPWPLRMGFNLDSIDSFESVPGACDQRTPILLFMSCHPFTREESSLDIERDVVRESHNAAKNILVNRKPESVTEVDSGA